MQSGAAMATTRTLPLCARGAQSVELLAWPATAPVPRQKPAITDLTGVRAVIVRTALTAPRLGRHFASA